MIKKTLQRLLAIVRPWEDRDRGMALIIALMLLSVLTLLGSSTLLTTNVEVRISHSTKLGRTAFFRADGAGQIAANVVDQTVYAGWWSSSGYAGAITVNDANFWLESFNLDDDGDGDADNDVTTDPDLTFGDPYFATVDVDVGWKGTVEGSSLLTASGYEGAGKGMASGGFKTVFHMRSRGRFESADGVSRAVSLLFMTYDYYKGM